MTGAPLPNAAVAIVARRKVVDYLLSEAHPDGRGKARFFSAHGFVPSDWEALAAALREHVMTHGVVEAVETSFGSAVCCPGHAGFPGRPAARGAAGVVHPKTVWFIRKERDVPEPVTAYPLKRRS